jgi:hypothetical protein
MRNITGAIPVEMYPEMEAWGKLTAEVFGKLRSKAGLPPKDLTDNEEWFWSDAWQQMEREADEDIAAGRVKRFTDLEALFADLDGQGS